MSDRQVFARIFFQQRFVLLQQLGGARPGVPQPWPALCQKWQDLMAQEIAVEARALVAFVVYPAQILFDRIFLERLAGMSEQRSPDPPLSQSAHLSHGAQAAHASAAQ